MTNDEIITKIREYLKWSHNSDKEITITDRLKEDLELDSIDIIELTLEIEQAFNMRIPDNEIEYCKTVKDLLNSIHKYERT